MNNQFDNFHNPDELMDTIAGMFQFQGEFKTKIDVEAAMDRALEYSQWLIALQYEIGKRKNKIISEEKKKIRQDKQTYLISLNYGKLKDHYKDLTQGMKERFRKLEDEKYESALEELENEYDVVLKFINEQMWLLKSYMKNLEPRLQYFAFLEGMEKNH